MHEIEHRMATLRLMLADITARQEQSQTNEQHLHAHESAARTLSQQADRHQPLS